MVRTTLVGVTLLALLVAPLPASAGKPRPSGSACTLPATDLCTDYAAGRNKWAPEPIVYYVNPSGAPPGFVEAVQAAFDAWELEQKSPAVENAHPGDRSTIDFSFGGTTTRVAPKRDGFNVVGLGSPSSCDHCAGTSNTTSRGQIVESDISFDPGPTGDAADVWSTDLSCPSTDCNRFDVHGAATHEIGHLLGLFHVPDDVHAELTMSPRPRRDDTFMRTLGAGDVLGVRKLYPEL